MQLPTNANAIIAAFKGLSEDRKKEIVAHLALVPEARRNATITTLIKNGGEEGRFVSAIFGQHPTGEGSSPKNKSLGAPERK